MSLMRLAPETVRLRRIAKAHAAGEFSRSEYRQARSEVIENFSPSRMEDDDTQRRWEAGSASEEQPGQSQVGTEPPARAGQLRLWLGGLLLVGGLAFAVQVWASVQIPPVSQRDPNPLLSPRLEVSQVRVRNFQPLRGVDAAAVDSLLGAKLAEITSRNAAADHGFTAPELAEVGRFLNALGLHGDQATPSSADMRDLAALVRDQKTRRGVSIKELEELARYLQEYYRQAGYLLAVAYVPSQTVSDGAVALEVLPGVLGSVAVTGGGSELVQKRFADLLGKPVTEQTMAARLYALNQLPGLTAQASFEEGTEVGQTQLNLNLVERQTWSFTGRADNYGDDQTGDQRLAVAGSWLSPRGVGDALQAGLLVGANPWNQVYGFVEYDTPVGGAYELRTRLSNNDFTWERGSGLDGTGLLLDVAMQKSLLRSRQNSAAVELGVAQHRLSWEDDIDQTVSLVRAALTGDRVWDGPRIAADGRVQLEWGRIGDDLLLGQDPTFWDVEFQAFVWTPLNLALLPGPQKLSLSLIGQMSDSRLPSTRRLALGGIAGSKAFQRDAYLADRGAVVDLSLHVPAPVGELVLFADTGFGEDRNDVSDSWGHLTSLGVGWDAELITGLVSRLSWALPVSARGTGGLDDDGPRLFWSLQYSR